MTTDYSKLFNDAQNLKLKQSSDTSTNWNKSNRILFEGEIAYEKDTHKIKVGDGKTSYNDLPYVEIKNETESNIETLGDDITMLVKYIDKNKAELDNKIKKVHEDCACFCVSLLILNILTIIGYMFLALYK